MFPLGFNLADFKNDSKPKLDFPGANNFPQSLSTSQFLPQSQPSQQFDDDSSADNKPSSTNLFQTLSTFTAPNPDLIQANLEKMMVSDALEVVTTLPMELNLEDNSDGKAELSDMDMTMDNKYLDEDEYLSLADISLDTVLPDSVIPFSFKLPSSVPPYLNAHYTCETGSRLLFSSILWLGKVPVFQQLPEDLQSALIKAGWAEVFVLNFAQMSGQLSFNAVMSTLVEYFRTVVGTGQQDQQQQQPPPQQVSVDKMLTLSDNICLFNEFVRDVEKLQLDDVCYAALRVILVFSGRGVRRDYPNYTAQLDKVVEVASGELRRQLARMKAEEDGGGMQDEGEQSGGAEDQFVKVVMKVTTLSKLNGGAIEELFFTNMVGHVSVENVIPYILRLGSHSSSNNTVPVSGWRRGEKEEWWNNDFVCFIAGESGRRTLEKLQEEEDEYRQ